MPKTKSIDLRYYNYAHAWYMSFDADDGDDESTIKHQLDCVRKHKQGVHTLSKELHTINDNIFDNADVLTDCKFIVRKDDFIMFETETCIVVRQLEYNIGYYSKQKLNNPLKHSDELSVVVFADKLNVATMNAVYNYLSSTLAMSEF